MPIISHGGEEFHLSHEEEDKLNHFQAVTNFPENELSLIIKLLKNHSWQLEPAISRYFDSEAWKDNLNQIDTPPVLSSREISSTPSDRVAINPSMVDQVRNNHLVAILPVVHALPHDYKNRFKVVGLNNTTTSNAGPSLLVLILTIIPNTIIKIISFIFSFFVGSSSNKRNNVIRVPQLPISETNFIDLSKIIKDSNKLTHVQQILANNRLPFNECLRIAREEFKFLLVVLIGETNDTEEPANNDINSIKFLTEIITDNGVLKILDEYQGDLIVYMGCVNELEPWLVARELHVKYTPELLLLGNVLNRNGSINGAVKLSVLSKLKISTTKKFQNSLKLTLERFSPELIVSKTEMEELKISRQIKQLQENAFNESLRKDKIKEEQRKSKENELKLQQELKLQEEKLKKRKDTVNNLKWLKLCIDLLKNQEPEKREDVKHATLQIRTSNGERIIKKFSKNTTLHSIYLNVGCHLYLKNNRVDSEDWRNSIVQKIKELISDETVLCFKDLEVVEKEIDEMPLSKIIDKELTKWENGPLENEDEIFINFELVSPFPRYKVPLEKDVRISEVNQLWPNGSLLVEDIVELEESDSEEE
ncbi:hypothetical protein KAFR_0C05470 [Kazachstania africana CBS 2517]|uniref:UBX domain-containing protein n=1 Tax=Kazachstania africana (strain ATCC 22294 / BCRC 22015 / CBS 2517 / CECT 1963 / NBRC 1671 / NRRL Y-8276) TaxID=1071382 RepID=H2AT38_KAZAF|nr:hypothetical protein KAFR_0C05470 [Kazachstania africana CBS 2517]CCF57538.1 hypothetical protein KAFR_0C05470 [Kazachstania africana CBS 2517]